MGVPPRPHGEPRDQGMLAHMDMLLAHNQQPERAALMDVTHTLANVQHLQVINYN